MNKEIENKINNLNDKVNAYGGMDNRHYFELTDKIRTLGKRIEVLEQRAKFIRHYCPKCNRETITTTEEKQKYVESQSSAGDIMFRCALPFYETIYTCEICGTQYKMEEKPVIIDGVEKD